MNLKLGSSGVSVSLVQQALKTKTFYAGTIDGIFGRATEFAVEKFQINQNQPVTGVVDSTLAQLLNIAFPANGPETEELIYRCLALTGSFETSLPRPDCFSAVTGDFDGQGISFGALQQNFNQGSLQPLLLLMLSKHSDVLKSICGAQFETFQRIIQSDKYTSVAWARSIQDPRKRVIQPWLGIFAALGASLEYQQIQVDAANKLFASALKMARIFALKSERAVALMFDIAVQNGSIAPATLNLIQQDLSAIHRDNTVEEEPVVLRVIATRRAEVCNPQWVNDVRARKLTIANGDGIVHGTHYRLDEYGIRLEAFGEL